VGSGIRREATLISLQQGKDSVRLFPPFYLLSDH
jgi:hypothetical protein